MVRACIIADPVLTSADLFNTLEVLAKLARTSPQQGPALQLLVEQARRPKCAPCCFMFLHPLAILMSHAVKGDVLPSLLESAD